MDKFILDLLDAREERYEKQRALIDEYKRPIISFMLNTPGREKYSKRLLAFQRLGIEKLEDLLGEKILYSAFKEEETGSYYLAAVDMDALALKKLMIDLENSPAGRLYDLDVFDENKKQITRSLLGMRPRTCLLCSRPAKICIREKTHSFEELVDEMNRIIDQALK